MSRMHPPTCEHGATIGDCYKCSSDPYVRVHGFLIPGEVKHLVGGCHKCRVLANDGSVFDADYFLRGKQTGKSLYSDYRWLPELTIPMVQAIIDHCGIIKGQWILDYGCARGYTVRALLGLGYQASGYDVSRWAIDNCDPEVRGRVTCNETVLENSYDWIFAKDVLEHIEDVDSVVDMLMDQAQGVFVVVPLAHGKTYDVEEYEQDVTHIHRHPLMWWVSHFHRPGWAVESRYRVPGVKDNYAQYPTGNAFITAWRIEV